MSTLETNLVQPSTGTALTIGASGDTITVPSGATFNVAGTLQSGGSAITEGIKNAQSYYLSGSKTIAAGTATVIDSAFTALDTTKVGIIGSASNVTVSSGIFSFATTGIYLVETTMNFYTQSSTDSRYVMGNVEVTANNSSYSVAAQATGQISDTNSGNNDNCVVNPSALVDVDDTSNVKVRLAAQGEGEIKTETQNKGFIIRFIRLSDT